MDDAQIPDHVRAAFGGAGLEALPVVTGSGTGWAVGDLVLSPVSDVGLANWSARVRENLQVEGMRIAVPVRSRDGRLVVSGWRADRVPAGRPEARADESIVWALRLSEALKGAESPSVVTRPAVRPWSETDVLAFAEVAAWNGHPEVDLAPGMEDRGTPFATHRASALMGAGALIRRREPVAAETAAASTLVHGDLAHALLFDASGAPALADLVPFVRPPVWSAALVAVDHLTWGTTDPRILDRWSHLPDWPQLVLRAAAFRLCIHAIHPGSRPEILDGLRAAAQVVESFLSDVER